jgi:hypothetical protein
MVRGMVDRATAARNAALAREQLAALEASYQAESGFRKSQAEANIPRLVAARRACPMSKVSSM